MRSANGKWSGGAWRSGLALGALLLAGCTEFDGPPVVTLVGANQGVLPDVHAPVVLSFSKPVDKYTLGVKLARYVVDVEGNLSDEDADPNTALDPIFERTPAPATRPAGSSDHIDDHGVSALSSDGKTLTITPSAVMPIGPELVVVIEPGLASPDSLATTARRRITFAYGFKLDCNAPVKLFQPGLYYFQVQVQKPISVQVRLYGEILLDATTGALEGQFTNAHRNPTPNRCPQLMCASTDVCRTLPAPACVAPSEPEGTVDEFPDYVPNVTPPTGFSFTASGCAKDDGTTSTTFSTAPVDVVVQQPPVRLRNAVLTASFAADAKGVLRGTGSLTADDVLLGTSGSGSGHGEGTLTARSLTAADTPPGLPMPPPVGDH